MKHMSNKYAKICKLLFIANIIFWFYVAILYLGHHGLQIITALLFLEALLYLIGFVGLLNKHLLLIVFSIFLSGANAILSLTDEFGVLDFASFVLSLLLFVFLIFFWQERKEE